MQIGGCKLGKSDDERLKRFEKSLRESNRTYSKRAL